MDEQSQDWLAEQERVEKVKHEIEIIKRKLKTSLSQVRDRVIELRENFWEDVTVNLEEMDDVIETQASIKQQAELLSERERSHGQWSERLKTLDRLKSSPYFGRIDFVEDGEQETDEVYIGIASLMDAKDENFLIYDWRAPISSMYYDYPPGQAQYDTVDGTISGEITLKRQYIIRNGQLKGMFNTGLTIGDHLLQAVLGENASDTMESIVSTIQKEQNQIIRNERNKILIVQGVAGSGKTSAALQRVAYLLYRHRITLTSENILLFSPNPLFNSYVANVLPELGEENMKQTTFQQHLEEGLGSGYQMETPFEQMEAFLTKSYTNHNEKLAGIQFKSTLTFKQLIDNYIKDLSGKGIQFRNISFKGNVLLKKEEIRDYFYSLDDTVSIGHRMDEVSQWILTRLKEMERAEREKDWVLEEVELLDKDDYVRIFHELDKEQNFNEDTFDDFIREEDQLRKLVVARRLNPLKKKVEKLAFVNVLATYVKFYQEWSQQNNQQELVPENWQAICEHSVDHLKRKHFSWEEATPYLYFKERLLGFIANKTIRHVFIDEAQDYSDFQFAYLKEKFPSSQFTVLGDMNQAIYAHALQGDTVLEAEHQEKMEKLTLTRSYRSTKEIVEFTKHLVKNGNLIQPFNREGEKPTLQKVSYEKDLLYAIMNQVGDWRAEGYETIAVICKSMEESQAAYERLSELLSSVSLITEETTTFEKGIVIVPAYLAKGIEFDGVILYNVSKEVYDQDSERNLFYTACTRAMHELVLMSIGEPSHFLHDVPEEKYEIKES
ncbi:RNA polymerase recycling motor HelD [Salinibacillus xinjiangensis]|uniref:AAA family ATPase n=1 Tax=Salinibacillus xinjiangensis TaxID=1229268 RepID=A0A6G1X5Q6_9BACI|nr:RNA polymerase recycling motor HelD [Salinibacillus xinjiangensis]MRG86333.1 AAA family ATPase [Salinibacillus xinjiangensis]